MTMRSFRNLFRLPLSIGALHFSILNAAREIEKTMRKDNAKRQFARPVSHRMQRQFHKRRGSFIAKQRAPNKQPSEAGRQRSARTGKQAEVWRTMNVWVRTRDFVFAYLGGPKRARVIILLAAALGLDGANLGAVGSMSSILEHHFSITKAQVGLLISAAKGVGVFSTLFFGSVVDHSRRTRLLAIVVMLWSLAILACGAASSYFFLVMTQVALGVVAAATVPCTASLIGDYFPGAERGKVYGYILSGEIIGTGIGFILSGELAGLFWRVGFWVLAIPSLPLAWFVYRLPEPERGGGCPLPSRPRQTTGQPENERLMAQKVREAGIQPRQRLIRHDDPAGKSIWWSIRFVLSIPTNSALIVGSALGYAFFTVIRTFGIQYAQSGYHLKHSNAVGMLALLGIGSLAGVWLGGQLSDRLLARGYLRARVWVATICFWCSVFLFFFGFYFQIVWLSLLLFVLSALALGAVNPPLDSARLDIVHPLLWGRAEAVRIILRDAGEAVTPALFGWLVTDLGGPAGLREGFLIMLVPLAFAGAVALITFRTYPPDAAAAAIYLENTQKRQPSSASPP